jgi:RNA recognition motif-containing protein
MFIYVLKNLKILIKISIARVYLGSCSYDITDEAVKEAFGKYGDIVEIDWVTDKETGKVQTNSI